MSTEHDINPEAVMKLLKVTEELALAKKAHEELLAARAKFLEEYQQKHKQSNDLRIQVLDMERDLKKLDSDFCSSRNHLGRLRAQFESRLRTITGDPEPEEAEFIPVSTEIPAN